MNVVNSFFAYCWFAEDATGDGAAIVCFAQKAVGFWLLTPPPAPPLHGRGERWGLFYKGAKVHRRVGSPVHSATESQGSLCTNICDYRVAILQILNFRVSG